MGWQRLNVAGSAGRVARFRQVGRFHVHVLHDKALLVTEVGRRVVPRPLPVFGLDLIGTMLLYRVFVALRGHDDAAAQIVVTANGGEAAGSRRRTPSSHRVLEDKVAKFQQLLNGGFGIFRVVDLVEPFKDVVVDGGFHLNGGQKAELLLELFVLRTKLSEFLRFVMVHHRRQSRHGGDAFVGMDYSGFLFFVFRGLQVRQPINGDVR